MVKTYNMYIRNIVKKRISSIVLLINIYHGDNNMSFVVWLLKR